MTIDLSSYNFVKVPKVIPKAVNEQYISWTVKTITTESITLTGFALNLAIEAVNVILIEPM